MTVDEICALTLVDASAALDSGALSPVDLIRACLDRISRLDAEYNSFIRVYREQALEDAERLTTELKQSRRRGPLHGIPIALKDLVDVAGEVTTAASAAFLNNRADEDAEVVRRLKSAGAIVLGKTNLHEFAYGGSGMISHFGTVRNPVDARYITGGSSSGSAAAVAAQFCFAAIGTDTAGSIRLPAALCGVVGLKPTFAAVSAEGVVPLAWSYDHVGPMARTVADVAAMWRMLSGDDRPEVDGAKLKFGIARKYFCEDCDAEIAAAVEKIAEQLRAREVEIPVDEDRTVSSAEAFAYHEPLLAEKAELYQPETLRRIRSGEKVTAAAFIRRKRELDEMRRRAHEWFKVVDVILTPTVPIKPSLITELQENPAQLRPRELLMLRNTRPFNVLGVPTISVPCGRTRNGLPIGVQIAGAPGREDQVLAAAKWIEKLVG